MNTKKVYELCPHCENEVKIPVSGPSHCPVCDKIILPCAMCIDCVSPCPYESEKLKLFVREKLEEVVWLDGRTSNFEEEEIEDLAYDLKSDFEGSQFDNSEEEFDGDFDEWYEVFIEETLMDILKSM